ncbi:MAG TPA: hypothetical protein VFD01_08085 [Candidatus Dormibacteraeota bacterium]|nr:hypothetical protein [Candidatus Dormibacteraeota bacterium]
MSEAVLIGELRDRLVGRPMGFWTNRQPPFEILDVRQVRAGNPVVLEVWFRGSDGQEYVWEMGGLLPPDAYQDPVEGFIESTKTQICALIGEWQDAWRAPGVRWDDEPRPLRRAG